MVGFSGLADLQQHLFRGGALAVRRQADADAVVRGMVPLLNQGDIGRKVRAAFVKIHHAMSQQGAHAAVPYSLGFHVHVHVHVVEGGGAEAEHLHDAQVAARTNGLVGEVLFHRKNGLIEPAVQRKVAADAAKQGHGGMGVHVAKSRHGQHAAAVNHLIRFKGRGAVLRASVGDAAAVHQPLRVGDEGNVRLVGHAGHEQNIGDSNSHGTIFLLCQWPHYSIARRI